MSCLCETEGRRVPASSVCRGGALEPCRCPGTCRLSPGVHECTCVDGSVGRQSCFDGAETACSCEPDSVRCRVGDSLACRCADGSVGAQLCETFDSRPEGILGPCECRGGGGPLDASVGDDGGPVATDAAWPDGCSPISCAERGCGTHTASCGVVVDCGPCEAVRRTLELEARDLLWDASRGMLYVSVPSSEPRGNTVGAVDPLTLERTFDVIVGSEPGAMMLDEDASALYVHLEGSDSLRRVDLGRREAGLEIPLEPGTFVGDMGLIPGRPESLVLSLWTGLPGGASGFSSLVVYDGATRRSDAVSFGEGNASFIEVLDAGTVVGVGEESVGFASTFTLDAAGIREMSEHAIGSRVGDIALLGDLLYGETGLVIDPRSWEITRRLPASGRVAFDQASGRLYFLDIYSREERRALVSVDLATAELRGRLELAAGAGSAWDLVVWRADGRGGVAYLEAEGNGDLRPTRLVVVETNLVVVR